MPGMVHASIFNDMPGFPPALRSFYTHIVYFHSSSSVTNCDLDINSPCPVHSQKLGIDSRWFYVELYYWEIFIWKRSSHCWNCCLELWLCRYSLPMILCNYGIGNRISMYFQFCGVVVVCTGKYPEFCVMLDLWGWVSNLNFSLWLRVQLTLNLRRFWFWHLLTVILKVCLIPVKMLWNATCMSWSLWRSSNMLYSNNMGVS